MRREWWQHGIEVTEVCPAGLHHRRLVCKRTPLSCEDLFRQAWQAEHAGPEYGYNSSSDMLAHLLNVVPERIYFPQQFSPVSERDRVVAATVVQWLGTNMGMLFLEEILRVKKMQDEARRQKGEAR